MQLNAFVDHTACLLYRGPEHSSCHGLSWKMQAVYAIKLSSLATRYIRQSVLGHVPRRYPYFDVVVGLVWSHDPKSYAGGSVCYW
jgi:hypothetical protein